MGFKSGLVGKNGNNARTWSLRVVFDMVLRWVLDWFPIGFKQGLRSFLSLFYHSQCVFSGFFGVFQSLKPPSWPLHRGFAERLVAFAAVEGILFSGSFCALFWLSLRLCQSQECFCIRKIAVDHFVWGGVFFLFLSLLAAFWGGLSDILKILKY